MSLYNIEIFKKDFSYVSSYQLFSVTYEYDYLSIGNNRIQIPEAIAAEQGDYIRITGDSDRMFGIIGKVTDSDTFYTITYKPLMSMFDTNMYMDREKLNSLSLEEWIKEVIQEHYVNSGDVLQNLKTVNIATTSETFNASLDNESNIENLYELLKTALIRYGVSVDVSVDPALNNIDICIGKSAASERIIEADLPNVITKGFTTTNSSRSAVNKLYVVNEKDESRRLVYYLTKSGTVKKEPDDSERVTPVLFDTVFASAGEDEEFEDIAYEKALTELSSGCDNLIELTVLKKDDLIRPDTWNMGDAAKILKGGKEFRSILTGKKYDGQTVTLIFGSIRLELTKKIKKKEQEKLDTKVKNLESKVNDINNSVDQGSLFGQRIVSVPVLPTTIADNVVYLIQGEVTVE